MVTVGDGSPVPRAAKRRPYDDNRKINRNLNFSIIIVFPGFFVNAIDSNNALW